MGKYFNGRNRKKEHCRHRAPLADPEETQRELDRDFGLVVRAMTDDKARELRSAEARVAMSREREVLERNRAGMALAEVESLWMQRKVEVPRWKIPRQHWLRRKHFWRVKWAHFGLHMSM